MPESIYDNYEVSSEGAVRHWEIPYASMDDTTPTPTQPAMVSGTAGLQLCGTVLSVDAVRSVAVVDFTPTMVYSHLVRTVSGYSGGVEYAWADINIGTPIYYDNSATMPAGCKLSLSAQNNAGATNPLYGWAVPANENDTFPKAAGTSGNTHRVAVMQRGGGA